VEIADALSGQRAIGKAARRLAVVGDMDPDETADLAFDVVVERRRVPKVPRVELDPERRRVPRVADQLHRFGDRRDERPLSATDALVGLEPDA
jgi:hypothetical protein